MADLKFDALVGDPRAIQLFRQLWKDSPADRELSTWVVRITSPQPDWILERWPLGESNHAKTPGILQAATAIVHTHPVQLTSRFKDAEKPSTSGGDTGRGDWGTAVKVGKSVYVISALAIWKILPNATYPEMYQVAGSNW